METTLGGERLGSGGAQKVHMKNFERSTHDLGYIWRSTMSAGTLVPFMTEVGLPGDTFDIDLECMCRTHPTIGPLFGSFKIQLDVFQTPIRLYNAKLHQNKLGIGMKMQDIKLPQVEVYADANGSYNRGDNSQINPSCLLSYLNIRGIGISENFTSEPVEGVRYFNAVPLLIYWDIYKNYYANKMEEIGCVVHNDMMITNYAVTKITWCEGTRRIDLAIAGTEMVDMSNGVYWTVDIMGSEPSINGITVVINDVAKRLTDLFDKIEYINNQIIASKVKVEWVNKRIKVGSWDSNGEMKPGDEHAPRIQTFSLSNIDEIREEILAAVKEPDAFTITAQTQTPHGSMLNRGTQISAHKQGFSKLSSQEGLAIKTYQSDLFNNWVSTEWIDGDNGINAITAIDTSEGSFTIDTLNLSNKVYNMLNRIAMSGGSYDDWLDAVYTHERARSVESPVYMGSLIRELSFEEVLSTTATENAPLGTLAGRGQMTNKKKGGKIRIKVSEPSYIMGIVSLTPRLDYSQGNKWDVNLKTMDDFHKPSLDEIGFQDLITDQMAWWDTKLDRFSGFPKFNSAGKQPAWINYMTNVNQVRGNFAEENQQMWMTLNRKYGDGLDSQIVDMTTYVDPMKFNHIFSDTSYDAQNFWMQIALDIKARRKMSAKQIPNL